jgi:histone deacetylase 6
MGEPPMKIKIPPLNRMASHVLHQVKQCHAPYWQCLREGVTLEQEMQAYGAVRLHDKIRSAQRDTLSKKHKMVSLYVQRPTLSRSFEGQVLATPNIYQAKKILLIIHDP